MATRTWLDTDGDWENTANWSGATVPAEGDTAIIDSGNKAIVTNVDQSDVDAIILKVGPRFTGTIGTAAAPLKLGCASLQGAIDFNAPLCEGAHLQVVGAAGYSRTRVYNTSALPYGFHLLGGTVDIIHVAGGRAQLGGSVVAGQIMVHGRTPSAPFVQLESGLSFADDLTGLDSALIVFGGTVDSLAELTSVLQSGGKIDQRGTTTGDITGIVEMSGGLFVWRAPGSTVYQVDCFGGTFDGSRDATAKTLSASRVFTGGMIDIENGCGTIIQTAALKVYGGQYRGFTNPDIVIPPQ